MDSKRIEIEGNKRPMKTPSKNRIGLTLLGALCMAGLACKEKSGGGAPAADAKPVAPMVAAQPAAPPESAKPAAAPQAAKPEAKTEVKTGKIDFTIPVTPITKPLAGLSGFAGRNLLIFYFGPTCPHCQAALPEVQAFADEILGKGYETIAIANQRSNQDEIQEFITKYKCKLPVFWDEQRRFGGSYGVTVLPTLFLVKAGGDFIRTDGFSGKPTLEQLRRDL